MIPTFTMSSEEVNKAFAKLKRVSAEMEGDLRLLVTRTAADIHREAVNNLGKNNTNVDGRLRSSLRYTTDEKGRIAATVKTDLFYAPYVEFGTKSRFGKIHPKAGGGVIDADLRDIAAQYRGSRGGSGKLIDALKIWARKRGIPEEAVGAIYISIARHGVHAQPFLFPAAKKIKPKYMKSLQKILDRYSARP